MHYLDNAATTRVLPEAAEAVLQAMRDTFGNPSSQHQPGLDAARLLQNSREIIAAAIHAAPEETYFTPCGTQSTNISLRGAAFLHRHKKGRIITTSLEHAATAVTCKTLGEMGFEVVTLAADRTGHIHPDTLSDALTDDTFLLSCHLVNNELGTVQPVETLGQLLKTRCPNALFHIDAVQGLCRVPLTPRKWHCDLMSLSGHKIGAPKGIGALYIRKGLRLPPLVTGGGQERNISSGTEPVPAAAGFAKACEIRMAHFDRDNAHVADLAAYLREQVAEKLPCAVFNIQSDVPHIQSLSLARCKSEVVVRVLSDEGVYVSAGSACSKGRQSGVLSAIGLPTAQSDGTLRLSFCPENTRADIDAFLSAVPKAIRLFGFR